MKKLFLFSLMALLLMGAGCSSVPPDHGQDSYYYGDYDDTSYDYDDSYDSYDFGAPQGYQDVYACNLDQDYCNYIEVNIVGSEVSSVYTSYYVYPSESYCDAESCYFVDGSYNEWYFEF